MWQTAGYNSPLHTLVHQHNLSRLCFVQILFQGVKHQHQTDHNQNIKASVKIRGWVLIPCGIQPSIIRLFLVPKRLFSQASFLVIDNLALLVTESVLVLRKPGFQLDSIVSLTSYWSI